MQTILGANGIIGEELAKELRAKYTNEIRLVGRKPQSVHARDELFSADLLDAASVKAAVKNTEIAYLTVGLPYRSAVWLRDWPIIMKNVIAACQEHNCKLVYFDNTYAYPQDAPLQTEATPFAASGKKGVAKKEAAELLLKAMEQGEIRGTICRAPEFYGPGKTKSITNTMIFENLQKGRKPQVLLDDKLLRTLIYTPDASKATALIGNTPDAYQQSWHLPCDDSRLTYERFMKEISHALGREIQYDILKPYMLKIAAWFNSNIKETLELLPRYTIDNIFDSTKFKTRFPDFRVTTYQDGIRAVLADLKIK
jgi:nucleoside-diphosphate-sugar epimerase